MDGVVGSGTDNHLTSVVVHHNHYRRDHQQLLEDPTVQH